MMNGVLKKEAEEVERALEREARQVEKAMAQLSKKKEAE